MAAQQPRGSAATQRSIEHSSAALSTAANRHMETHYDWYRDLSAEDRSWVGLVAQAGIAAFIAWYQDPSDTPQLSVDVFGTAPRELTRSISLVQTLDLVRSVIDVVEDDVAQLAAPGDELNLREAVLRYSREVAFAAAEVYAGAAEARGAWDARLESLVVDAVLRGEADDSMQSRASALGWGSVSNVSVIAGMSPAGNAAEVVDLIRRGASRLKIESLAAVQGQRLVVILGGLEDPSPTVRALAQYFGDGPIVIGPTVPHLFAAGRSARAALSGLGAARAWPVGDPAEEVVVAVRRGRRRDHEEAHDAEKDHDGDVALAMPVPGCAHPVYLLRCARDTLLMVTRRRRPRFSPQPIPCPPHGLHWRVLLEIWVRSSMRTRALQMKASM